MYRGTCGGGWGLDAQGRQGRCTAWLKPAGLRSGSLWEQTPVLLPSFPYVVRMAGVVSREGMQLGFGGLVQRDEWTVACFADYPCYGLACAVRRGRVLTLDEAKAAPTERELEAS